MLNKIDNISVLVYTISVLIYKSNEIIERWIFKGKNYAEIHTMAEDRFLDECIKYMPNFDAVYNVQDLHDILDVGFHKIQDTGITIVMQR
jgi:hypothetical protein